MTGKKKSVYRLEDQVGHLLRRANQRHAAIFFDSLGQKLTPMQFAVLVKIGDEDEVSQNLLGRLAAMDPATVQGVVRRLRERGLITARPDPEDGRRSLWSLSNTGKTLIQETLSEAEVITERTLKPLDSKERATFLRLLRKLS